MSAAERFETQRGRLLGLAYRMLGSRADAEDVVQDAWLKWAGSPHDSVRIDGAYLKTIVTRLCLDRLRSERARQAYVGPWLPEPIVDADALGAEVPGELAEDLSFALLLALERLSPLERAAFLLHDVFTTPFSDIALTLDRSEAAVRQLAARARKAVRGARPSRPALPETHERLLAAFMLATRDGDLTRLKALLKEDAVLLTDGGGQKLAALNPIRGADRIGRYFVKGGRKFLARAENVSFRPAILNGSPGVLVYLDGALEQTFALSVEDERITAIYVVSNPQKLERLAH